jgi:hypothetical protein
MFDWGPLLALKAYGSVEVHVSANERYYIPL